MTKDNKNIPLPLLATDRAKGLHHLTGTVTRVNENDDDDTEANSNLDPDNSANHGGNPEDNNKPTNKDDPYKTRYDELKRYHDQEILRLKEENSKLKTQKKPLEIPKTAEDLSKFRQAYPDLFDSIVSIVRTEGQTVTEDVVNELKELREARKQERAETDREKLLRHHPDAESLVKSEQFIEWFKIQTKGLQRMVESEDVSDVIEAFDIYKAKKGIKNKPSDAATRVKTGGSKTNPDSGKTVFTESQIAAMSDREYEQREQEILEARLDGRLLPG